MTADLQSLIASFKAAHTIPGVLGWAEGQRDGPCPRCGGVTKVHYCPKNEVAHCHHCPEIKGDVLDFASFAWDKTIGQILKEWGNGKTSQRARMPHNRIVRGKPTQDTNPTPKPLRELSDKRYGDTIRYPYHTPEGQIVGAACRRDWEAVDTETGELVRGKQCWQLSHDGNGYTKTLNGRVLPCYSLPAIKANPGLVFIVEGEPKCEALKSCGIVATCNAGGAGKWTYAHSKQLAALGVKRVIVLPDADIPGMNHAADVRRNCEDAGLDVMVIPPRVLGFRLYPKHGPDVADWLERGGTGHLLLALIEHNAPINQLIQAGGGDFDKTLAALEAWAERLAITTESE